MGAPVRIFLMFLMFFPCELRFLDWSGRIINKLNNHELLATQCSVLLCFLVTIWRLEVWWLYCIAGVKLNVTIVSPRPIRTAILGITYFKIRFHWCCHLGIYALHLNATSVVLRQRQLTILGITCFQIGLFECCHLLRYQRMTLKCHNCGSETNMDTNLKNHMLPDVPDVRWSE